MLFKVLGKITGVGLIQRPPVALYPLFTFQGGSKVTFIVVHSSRKTMKHHQAFVSSSLAVVGVHVLNPVPKPYPLQICIFPEVWRRILDTNVLGLCVATREALRDMKGEGVDGHVIHINSINGHQVSVLPMSNVYSASKFAVTALTETLRKELVGMGSRVKVTVSWPPFCFHLLVSQMGWDNV